MDRRDRHDAVPGRKPAGLRWFRWSRPAAAIPAVGGESAGSRGCAERRTASRCRRGCWSARCGAVRPSCSVPMIRAAGSFAAGAQRCRCVVCRRQSRRGGFAGGRRHACYPPGAAAGGCLPSAGGHDRQGAGRAIARSDTGNHGKLGGTPLRAEIQALAAAWQGPQPGRSQAACCSAGRARSRGTLFCPQPQRCRWPCARAGFTGRRQGRHLRRIWRVVRRPITARAAIGADLYRRVPGLQRLEQLADQLYQHRRVTHGVAV